MIGSLIIDKPEGITSHTVVGRVRRAARLRRVGHAGTLDPFATGALVVCVGRATRLMQFIVGFEKEYAATVKLGWATDTQDLTGKQISPLRSSNEVSLERVRAILKEFTGPQSQMPPMFSAKKVGGERLYRAAREGREVERKASQIVVRSIELQDWLDANEDGTREFVISMRCSSGTYVRTLAHDIGARLDVGAHLTALRRTAVGHFTLDRALTLDEVERMGNEGELEGELMSPSETLAHLPLVRLDGEQVRLITNGREIQIPAAELSLELSLNRDGQPLIRLCDEAGALVAVGDCDMNRNTARPRVVLADGG
jgi:tRNA pseudouridine55 synthase